MIFISSIFNLIFVLIFASHFVVFRNINKAYIILFCLFSNLLIYLFNYQGINFFGKIISFISFLSCAIFVFDGKLLYKFSIFILAYFIIGCSEFFAIYLITELNFYVSNNGLLLVIQLIATTQVINYLIGFAVEKAFKEKNFIKSHIPYFFPLLITALLLLFMQKPIQSISDGSHCLIIVYIFFFLDFLSIFILIYRNEKLILQKEIELLTIKQEFLNSKYELLNKNYETNFSFLHNALHSYATLKKLSENNKNEEFRKKIDELANETQNVLYQIYTNSPIISVLLFDNQDILNNNNITVTSTIKYDDIRNITLQQKADLFSTLLNFAIQQCTTSEITEKIILIKSDVVGYMTVIQISFSSNDNVVDDNSTIETIKYLKKNYSEKIDLRYNIKNRIADIIIIFSN